jgi:thiol-disulfide isomerase/thioredoxin
MKRASLVLVLATLCPDPLFAQQPSDPAAQAISQGDLYQSKRKYDLALDAYHKADKLSHHSSANCYLKIALVERKLGDFSSALDDAKRAVKVAGDDKSLAIRAHVIRATLLSQMAGKPGDKKLKEAEEELHQALALDPSSSIAHFDLGMVLLKQERDPEGIAELNTFIAAPGAEAGSIAEARRLIASPIRARASIAPDFSFATHESQSISNAGLRGKVVLLDFWGTWCPPCRESVPILREINKRYAGKPFQIVGVSSDDDEDVWKTFIAAQHMDWAEYIDLSGNVQESFKIESFPTYIVLDKDGVIRFRQSGFGQTTAMELDEAIGKAIKRPSDPKLAAALAPETSPPAVSHPATGASAVPPPANGTSASNNVSKLDSAPSASPAAIDGVTVTRGVYRNAALGMTFALPEGWNATKPETLHAINERIETAAKAAVRQTHPELADSVDLAYPRTIFYASKRGDWNGQSADIPSILITSLPSHGAELTISSFESMVVKQATAKGLKVAAPASDMKWNNHSFIRADFLRTVGSLQLSLSTLQTIAGDSLLTIELLAYSPEEVQQVISILQGLSIAPANP